MTQVPTQPNSQFQNVVFSEEARDELLKGATILAKAVASTMGPSGHSVIIDYETKAPLITKDGVTVAKSINLKHKLQRVGAQLLQEIAAKTNDLAGDGTTTATVLGHALLSEGIKMVATGRSSIGVKRGMDLATAETIKFLRENCVPVGSQQDIISVGTISANGDRKIGELLAQAIERVGADGIITCEPSKGLHTVLDISEGMQFDGGYLSPYFVTNGEKLTCEFENPYILVTNRKISALGDIVKVLELVHQTGKPLVVIADEVEGEALHTMIVNKMKGVMRVCAVKAPSFGDNRTDILQDISTVVGGQVIDLSSEAQLKNVTLDHLGTCKRIIVGRHGTTIVGATAARRPFIDERIATLRTMLSDTTLDDGRLARVRHRLAKLAGGVAIVRVGGSTEVEILERKDRVEDALNATVAATQEGIVPGGGTALFYASLNLRRMLQDEWQQLPEDVAAGVRVVANACERPLRVIVENTGVSHEVVASKLQEGAENISLKKKRLMKDETGKLIEWDNPMLPSKVFRDILGYDAANHNYTNLIEKGIIDPVKVTRYALEHACSVVGLMLTTNCVIVNETE